MTFDEFVESTKAEPSPPHALSPALEALWWSRKGDWHKAHEICQDAGNSDGDWVHAHLHRVEGDEGNAAYWYSRAGREHPGNSTDQEWEQMTRQLIEARGENGGSPEPPLSPKS